MKRKQSPFENFVTLYPASAAELCGQSNVNHRKYPSALIAHLDGLIRGAQIDDTLFRTVDALDRILHGDELDSFLDGVVLEAQNRTRKRLRARRPCALWGVTPIVNLISGVKANRMLGIASESVVFDTYYTTQEFDLNLREQDRWMVGNAPLLYVTYRWMVFVWALLTYDVFFLFNDRGILLPVGGYGSDRFGISLNEMEFLERAGKKLYTLAYGADYRVRGKTLRSGSYNFCMDCEEIGRHCICDDAAAEKVFSKISEYATAMLGTGLSLDYLPNPRRVNYVVVDADSIEPQYCDAPSGKAIKIVHAPNHEFFKGTRYLKAAVERLVSEGYSIDLQLLSGVSNEKVLALYRGADIVADQFIGGWFGLAAVEAMALGKPVLCYLRKSSTVQLKEEMPIIKTDPETLYDVLKDICEHPDKLPTIGRRSREYVEKYLSLQSLAYELGALYLDTSNWRGLKKVVKRGPFGGFSGWVRKRLRTSRSPVVRECFLALRESYRQYLRKLGQVKRFARRVGRGLLGYARSVLLWCRSLIKIGVFRSLTWLIVLVGRFTTKVRMALGSPKGLWGATPILTLPLLVRCDQMLGFPSKSLVYTTYHITSDFDISLKVLTEKVLGFRGGRYYRAFTWMVWAYAMMRFDIFHFFCDRGISASDDRMGINPRELALLRAAGKRVYTYTYGADVRTRKRTMALGQINLCMECPEPGKYCICDDEKGTQNIRTLERYATAMLAMGDMKAYVPTARELFFWPIDISKVEYVGVQGTRNGPLRVAHAPNHPEFKGTRYLLEAIDRLKSEGENIELIIIQGVSNKKVIELFATADLVAEQFLAGFHGYTAIEAMARGKPVIAYLREPNIVVAPESCPIINAKPSEVYSVLKDCLQGVYDLKDLGRKGRKYVEQNYSIAAVARRLGNLYMDTGNLPGHQRKRLQRKIDRISV